MEMELKSQLCPCGWPKKATTASQKQQRLEVDIRKFVSHSLFQNTLMHIAGAVVEKVALNTTGD